MQPSTASISLPIERWRRRWFKSRAIISVPPVVAPRIKTSESPTPSHTPPISVMISASPWYAGIKSATTSIMTELSTIATIVFATSL